MQQETPSSHGVLIWDLPTRLFHWALVLSVSGAFVSQWFYTRIPFWVHECCGLIVLVLIAFRLLWGFFGPRYARFAQFLKGPGATLAYFDAVRRRSPPAIAGHTPTGSWMIVVLLGLLAAQSVLGLYSNDEMDSAGPLVGWVSHALSNHWTGWHHRIANVLLGAIGLHVAAVLFYRVVLKEDLIRSLWTGKRLGLPSSAAIDSHRIGRALAILVLCGGALAALLALAPPIPDLLM
jgi:cytochrome b